jgi:hypothetical protein
MTQLHQTAACFLLLAASWALAVVSPLRAAEAPAGPTGSSADPLLAQRFSDLAKSLLGGKPPDEANFRAAAAMLQAARRLNPGEPRYPRLLMDALVRTGDEKAMLEAVIAYRRLPGRADDRVAQIEYIDLIVNQMQSVDEKLAYLEGLLTKDAVPAEVRSVAAVRAAGLHDEKREPAAAARLMDTALQLNPLNLSALRSKASRAGEGMGAAERLRLTLEMLRSNPAQSELSLFVARTLAEAGLFEESLEWYSAANTAERLRGRALPSGAFIEAMAQLYLAGRDQQARENLDEVLKLDPEHYPAIILRLLVERRSEKKDDEERLRVQARNTLLNRLALVRSKLGVAGATTRPVNEGRTPPPDLRGDDDLLNRANAETRAAYLESVGDLAWFEVFFNRSPGEAEALLPLLNAAAGADDAEATAFRSRLEGWIFLLQDKAAEARVKLTAVADRDAMAQLGLVRLTLSQDPSPQGREKARAAGAELLAKHAGGVQAAILLDGLRDLELKAAPGPQAAALKAELGRFPKEWLSIIERPRAFYSMRVDPVKVLHAFGEPLMVRVVITNHSNLEITIGPDGVIHPDLWFDVQPVVSGQPGQPILGAAIDRITDQIVLRPRQSVTRMVRLDQRGLAEQLFRSPTPPVGFRVVVRTNAMASNAGVTSGPCGFAVEMHRPMERAATPINDKTIEFAAAAAAKGDAAEKVRGLELLTITSHMMRTQKENAELAARAPAVLEPVLKARSDAEPSIRAWAGFLLAAYGPDGGRPEAAEKLLADGGWQARMLGLLVVPALPAERQRPAVQALADNDPEALVRDLAFATLSLLDRPATQPATQPGATGPGGQEPPR